MMTRPWPPCLEARVGGPNLLATQRIAGTMFDDPYLETCCRSALHRLVLIGGAGRPAGLKDGPCLDRLAGMELARLRPDGRFEITGAGTRRHTQEILKAKPAV